MKQLKESYRNVQRTAQYFDELERWKYIRMDGNESIDGLPEDFLKEALLEIMKGGHVSEYLATYPNGKKCIEAIAENVGVDRENILITNGSERALKMLFEVYVDKGDQVIMSTPTFEMYGVYCDMYGAETIRVPYDDDFVFPFEAYKEQISDGVKMAIITNPNNPTGTALDQDQLYDLVNTAQKYNTLMLIDEAYFGYYDITMVEAIRQYDNVIITRTFSKLMGLAGMRIGYIIADEKVIDDVKKISSPVPVDVLSLHIVEKLMKNTELIKYLKQKYVREKKYLIKKLKENRIPFRDGEANFVMIPCDKNLQEIYEAFKQEGILIACRFNKYIRINIGNESVTDKFINSYNKIMGMI